MMPAMHSHIHTHYHQHGRCNDAAILAAIQELKTTMTAISDRLDALTLEVQAVDDAETAVAAFVAGVPALVQAAVDAAIAAGATPAQLASFDELNARLTADAAKIAADVVANTGTTEGNPQPDAP